MQTDDNQYVAQGKILEKIFLELYASQNAMAKRLVELGYDKRINAANPQQSIQKTISNVFLGKSQPKQWLSEALCKLTNDPDLLTSLYGSDEKEINKKIDQLEKKYIHKQPVQPKNTSVKASIFGDTPMPENAEDLWNFIQKCLEEKEDDIADRVIEKIKKALH